jgi:hypothetical protein
MIVEFHPSMIAPDPTILVCWRTLSSKRIDAQR